VTTCRKLCERSASPPRVGGDHVGPGCLSSKAEHDNGVLIGLEGRYDPWISIGWDCSAAAPWYPRKGSRCDGTGQLIFVVTVAAVGRRRFCFHPRLCTGQVGEAHRPPTFPGPLRSQQVKALDTLQAVLSCNFEHEIHVFVVKGYLILFRQLMPGGQAPPRYRITIESDMRPLLLSAFTPFEGRLS
jgi:hypothetical protein